MSEWIKISERLVPNDGIVFLIDGDTVYIRGTQLQPWLFQLCGAMKPFLECKWTHWMPLPAPPEKEREA